MGFVHDFFSLSVVVPPKPRRKKLQVSYTLFPRRSPRIYVEYLDKNGKLVRTVKPPAPPDTGAPDTGAPQKPEDVGPTNASFTNSEKENPPVLYTSQDASTQTDFFWYACPVESSMRPQPQSVKKQSKNKDSTAIVHETTKTAKDGGELKSKQSKGSNSEADVLALVEQSRQSISKTDKDKEPTVKAVIQRVEKPIKKPEKKPKNGQPEKINRERKQPKNRQPSKKQPEEKNTIPLSLNQVHFAHLPRFPNPHRAAASSSSSSASDESNIDPCFAASMAQVPPLGYVSQMQEPEYLGTPAQHKRHRGLMHDNNLIQRSVNRVEEMKRTRKINEEATAKKVDETAAQEWIRERNEATEQAAAAWLGERQAARRHTIGKALYNENDQVTSRLAIEKEAARWIQQRANERYDSSIYRNNPNNEDKTRNQHDLNTNGYRTSPSPDEVVWDSTHNGQWTRPSDWASHSQPQKSSLSRSAPKIWDDREESADNQAKHVSFASPSLPAYYDPHEDDRGRVLSDMNTNVSHIPPYRRFSELATAHDLPEYKPHSGRKSGFESLPDPIFVLGSIGAAANPDERESDRTRSALVGRDYEMSGALDDITTPICTKKKNKKKVHYEIPSAASADSNDEDSNTDSLWVE